jgi:tripartite-type tricarboxylate transporter receptor subunit TctC
MKIRFKVLSLLIFATIMLSVASPGEAAMKCPGNVISWVVPFGPGGGTDRWARILSSVSFDTFGMAMRVRNRPGASGVVGWKWLLNQKADGCIILQASSTPTIAILKEKNSPVKASQIKIVGYLSSFRSILLGRSGKPWSTLSGLKGYAKKNPGKLTIGGSQSLALGQAFFFDQLGLKMNLIPYSSTGKATADFLGKHINTIAVTASTAKGLVPGKAVGIVNTSAMPLSKKLKNLKGIPTAKQIGLNGISFPRWVGVHPDTPDAIADEISDNIGKTLKHKAVKKLIKKIGEDIIHLPRAKAQKQYNKLIVDLKGAIPLLK